MLHTLQVVIGFVGVYQLSLSVTRDPGWWRWFEHVNVCQYCFRMNLQYTKLCMSMKDGSVPVLLACMFGSSAHAGCCVIYLGGSACWSVCQPASCYVGSNKRADP
jgi:hypothetical protein